MGMGMGMRMRMRARLAFTFACLGACVSCQVLCLRSYVAFSYVCAHTRRFSHDCRSAPLRPCNMPFSLFDRRKKSSRGLLATAASACAAPLPHSTCMPRPNLAHALAAAGQPGLYCWTALAASCRSAGLDSRLI
eukprot:scaffold34536_cov63-Phaeocystis_antarctica.AAC.3